jgi:hypothetical protein
MKIDAEDLKNILMVILVKIDHILFKSNAFSRVIAHKGGDDIPNHKECRLGKWYLSEAKERFGKLTTYKEIDTPHAIVHSSATEAAKLFANGYDEKVAPKVIELFTQMEDASLKLFELFDKMLIEYKENLNNKK